MPTPTNSLTYLDVQSIYELGDEQDGDVALALARELVNSQPRLVQVRMVSPQGPFVFEGEWSATTRIVWVGGTEIACGTSLRAGLLGLTLLY